MGKFKVILLGILCLFISSAMALPVSTFTLEPPTLYENGATIPATDILSYKLYCSPNTGGPYNVSWDMTETTQASIDVSACVNSVGTYYFVATAISSAHGTESAYSAETFKTYVSTDLGNVPMAPRILQVL